MSNFYTGHDAYYNDPLIISNKQLHVPGYLAANVAAMNAITTMAQGDECLVADTNTVFRYSNGAWNLTGPVEGPDISSGGTVTYNGNYTIRTFVAANSNFTADPRIPWINVLVVGGGGGGGFKRAGGGGAGGVVYTAEMLITPGTPYTIQVGVGGAGGNGSLNTQGVSGGNSSFGTLVAFGGGGGGGLNNKNGLNGASGGGACGSDGLNGTPGNGTARQGNNGGNGANFCGGGGGGAATAGANGASNNLTGGPGGNGIQNSISGTAAYYGGGGGGGSSSTGGMVAGGQGGGGTGGDPSVGPPTAGTANTGGGGGAGGDTQNGAAGGSGVVIIAYPTPGLASYPVMGDVTGTLGAATVTGMTKGAWKAPVMAATTQPLPANTYNNGSSGVGATLTANANGTLAIDGTFPQVGQRVLIKSEGGAPSLGSPNNGVYIVTQTGSASQPYILTRAPDFNSNTTIVPGSVVQVSNGSQNGYSLWLYTNNDNPTVGTENLNFGQVSPGSFNAVNGSVWIANNGQFVDTVITGDLSLSATGAATVDAINGVAYNADPLTQYLLLNGRSGGQTAYGGSAASQNLTLDSTSNATKGAIVLGPGEGGSKVGVNTNSPGYPLHVTGGCDSFANGPITITGGSGDTIGSALTIDASAGGGRKWSFLSTGPASAPGGVGESGAFAVYDSTGGTYQWVTLPNGHTNFAKNFFTDIAQLGVVPNTNSTKAIVVQAAAGQSVDLVEIQNNSAAVIASIDQNGNLTGNNLKSTGGSLQQAQEVAPATPPSNNSVLFHDTNDNKRAKVIKDTGEIDVLAPNARYNYLINGGFDFVQRWSSNLTANNWTATGRTINPDRWGLTAQTNACQYARVDTSTAPVTGITARYLGQFKQITAAGKIAVSQVLETKDVMAMRGRNVRFHVKMRYGNWANGGNVRLGMAQLNSSGTADTMPATFISAFNANTNDPTLGTNLAYITPTLASGAGLGIVNGAMTCTIQGTFQQFSAVFPVPSNCLNLVAMVWSDSQLSANDDLQLSEAQLTIGQEINDWFPLSISEELVRCQRFYCKTFPIDNAPTTNFGNTGTFMSMSGHAGAFSNYSWFPYPVRMRTNPTVTFYNPGANNNQARDASFGADCSSTATNNATENACGWSYTGNTNTSVGNAIYVHISADAEI